MRPGDPGQMWNYFTPFFRNFPNNSCYSSSDDGSDTSCDTDFGASYGGVWNISLPPAGLFWLGYSCDALLFWARALYDYALDRLANNDVSAGLRAFNTAKHLARYAMRLIGHQSYALIHEMGHTFRNDDFHCQDYSGNRDQPFCCFDTAAKAFLCRVRARLGLPEDELNTTSSGDDFNNPVNPTVRTRTCSEDRWGGRTFATDQEVSCFTGVEGEPYHDHEAVISIVNVSCTPTPSRTAPSRTGQRETCLILCEQVSQTPEELAACQDNCSDAEFDPNDVEQPV